MMLDACKKTKSTTTTPNPSSSFIKSNVHIVDSTQWILVSSAYNQSIGEFDYTFTKNTPTIDVKVGDIILGITGDGYLRKVVSVTITNTTMNLKTNQATLSDVFKTCSFNFSINMDGMGRNQGTGLADSFGNVTFVNNSNVLYRLNKVAYAMDPTWKFDFAFDSANGVTSYEASARGASYYQNYTLLFNSLQATSFANETKTLGTYSKKTISNVQLSNDFSLPIVTKMDVEFDAVLTTNVLTNCYNQYTYTTAGTFDISNKYTGSWAGTNNITATGNMNPDSLTASRNASSFITLVPKVVISIYGVPTFVANVGINGSLREYDASPNPDWDITEAGWWNTLTNSSGVVIGKNIPNFSQTWNADTSIYQTPYLLTQISGDNQSANAGTVLTNPLVVRVVDSRGNPQRGAVVYFSVTGATGGCTPSSVRTDANGYAQTIWTLGNTLGTQGVQAKCNLPSTGRQINGSPVSFTASAQ